MWSMPIVGVPPQEMDSPYYERMVPGSRVEYRGAIWKVIGMYFVPSPSAEGEESVTASMAQKRTKFLILKSLALSPEDLLLSSSARSS